ncbi:Uncharacterized membrane protein [Sporobacter termitidis DSM 10068]|uniref:Uncharacterized membrane protein n=1 Tax=Sporobacter termitidis DSM 10068 TaxID=1123282 RepID=A0A1M5Z641_9FIRM|nr:DUF1361 domain-containing protein [Sporobacter termitidis]SHI19726.1 Uncharacterized membrane protein [Sporobacter termitidis DSM 10068]
MKQSVYLFLCLCGYLAISIGLVVYSGNISFLFFVWNVFLAFLPFLFSRMLKTCVTKQPRRRAVAFLLAFLWFVFFPNAPYMITDLIYVSGPFYSYAGKNVIYSTDIYSWVHLVYIGLGAVFSALMGLRSMYEVHMLLNRRLGRMIGAFLIAGTCLLSGFAIYVGRILRFNSWDVLRPFSMLVRIREELSAFSILFSLLFSAYIAATYIVYYISAGGKPSSPGTGE